MQFSIPKRMTISISPTHLLAILTCKSSKVSKQQYTHITHRSSIFTLMKI